MSDPYDQVAYVSRPFWQTHPAHLAVLGRLHGLDPAPVESARVLDVGAGEGGNLVPLALTLPGATFVGIDLAAAPVERGARTVRELGLPNVRLLQMDLLDAAEELGTFDYVIAHGLYSWTPPAVRDGLLDLLGRCLSPRGLAYVSYTALPGGRLRQVLREAMLAATPPELREDVPAFLARSRSVLALLAQGRPVMTPFDTAVAEEARRTLEREENVVFHDLLAPFFEPVSLGGFAAHAARHGLVHVADAGVVDSWNLLLRPEALEEAARLVPDDPLGRENLVDALRLRTLRQSILACAEASPVPEWAPPRIVGCHVSSSARETEPGTFELRVGGTLTLGRPEAAGFLRHLASIWPADEVVDDRWAALVAELFKYAAVGVWTVPSAAGRAGERPRGSPLARLQAGRGDPVVASLDHRSIQIVNPGVRRFLALLDGRRTREELAVEVGGTREEVDATLLHLEQLALLLPG